MPTRLTGLLCGGLIAASAGPALAAGPFDVSIRVEAKRTLVKERTVTVSEGVINKDGQPGHDCSAQSALGALHQGTEGDWNGSFTEGLGYFVSEIKGVKPSGNDYFTLWVNNRPSSTGFCDTALKEDDEVLVFRQRCVFDPDTQACPEEFTPLGVRAPSEVKRNRVAKIKVVAYNARGRAKAARGAVVFVNGDRLGKTKRDGTVKVKGTKLGTATVYAKKRGHVRSETDRVRVVR